MFPLVSRRHVHTKHYNFRWYPLSNNSSSEYCTSPELWHVVYLLLFYDIWISWLNLLNGLTDILLAISDEQQLKLIVPKFALPLTVYFYYLAFWPVLGSFGSKQYRSTITDNHRQTFWHILAKQTLWPNRYRPHEKIFFLPSTSTLDLDPRPRPSTCYPRPSTLDKNLHSKRTRTWNTWTILQTDTIHRGR